jgi:L-lactate dehydrogenase complex protein LldG
MSAPGRPPPLNQEHSASARDRILGRLRAPRLPSPPALPDVAGWFAAHRRNEDLAQRCLRLRTALEASHAEVHDVGPTDWADRLLRIAAAKGLRSLLIGNATLHGAELEALAPAELALLRYDRAIEKWRDQLFDEVDASLTLARSAVAETGTLVLWPSPAEPRLMSLVPPLHFVLLDAATVQADFDAVLRTENWRDTLPTNALLISGPSKTADIQQTLAYGAHGPKELVVLLRHPVNQAKQGEGA